MVVDIQEILRLAFVALPVDYSDDAVQVGVGHASVVLGDPDLVAIVQEDKPGLAFSALVEGVVQGQILWGIVDAFTVRD